MDKKKKITQSYSSQKPGTRPGTKRMESGKRGEKSHRTLEQARSMSGPGNYEGQEHRKKYRTELGKLRKEHGLKKGDGKEVDHKKAASKGGSHSKENTRVVSRRVNRKKGSS